MIFCDIIFPLKVISERIDQSEHCIWTPYPIITLQNTNIIQNISRIYQWEVPMKT